VWFIWAIAWFNIEPFEPQTASLPPTPLGCEDNGRHEQARVKGQSLATPNTPDECPSNAHPHRLARLGTQAAEGEAAASMLHSLLPNLDKPAYVKHFDNCALPGAFLSATNHFVANHLPSTQVNFDGPRQTWNRTCLACFESS
jgi:hypothetical protein